MRDVNKKAQVFLLELFYLNPVLPGVFLEDILFERFEDIRVGRGHAVFGRGDKNRTRISGFGDRCTAIVLHPY